MGCMTSYEASQEASWRVSRKLRIKRNKLSVVGKQNSVKWVNSVTILDRNTYNVTVTVTDKT